MPVVKGGVWTNIEDEILKASVSKYGLNQWARVSSLLARKTPKQCKARWQEWLDPSIKKIEWSKEEDEKLLHLAKLMPTQWRTIAPVVGRTANQCLERYQKLLDEAEKREAAEGVGLGSGLGLMGPDGGETQAPSADDVRRLRPGEVDPDPETKPARPDTIDLDEDEKEMLSEARARLANTQGKKAKRKARERQQEESRRLAALQKRRELKGAGINIKVVTRKKGQMDYNADIPFEKKAAPGFYDTAEESRRNEYQREHFDPKKQQLGGKRKGEDDDVDEADRKRRKNGGGKDAQSAASVQAALKAGQMQKLREAEQSSKRRPLSLPAPQVSEGEMEEIVKMGQLGERASAAARAGDNDATRGLVADYTSAAALTGGVGAAGGMPIRTPRAPAQEDHIANEIRNIRALTETQSSLLGGENTPLREGASATTGFDSIAPRRNVVATPNPLATPLRAAGGRNGLATPLRPGQTPLRTPRDNFALNAAAADDSETQASATPLNEARLRETALRHQLRAGLASLPRPKNTEWELELPEEEQEQERQRRGGDAEGLEEDAAERDARARAVREAREALERSRRTQVVRRGLPRPGVVHYEALVELVERRGENADVDAEAEALVAREAALLMARDAVEFPLLGSAAPSNEQQKKKAAVVHVPEISDDALAEARLQILVEAENEHAGASSKKPTPEEVQAAWEKRAERSVAVRLGLGCYDGDDDDGVQVAALRVALDDVRTSLLACAEQGNAVESKLRKHLGGYKKRAETLRQRTLEAADALDKAGRALAGFRVLQQSEAEAAQRRLTALRAEFGFISTREHEAQEAYRRAKEELEEVMLALGGGGGRDGVNGVNGMNGFH